MVPPTHSYPRFMSFSRSFLIPLCMVWENSYFCNSGLVWVLHCVPSSISWMADSQFLQRPITINNHQWKLLLLLSSEFLTTEEYETSSFLKVSVHTWDTEAPVSSFMVTNDARPHNSWLECTTLIRLYNSCFLWHCDHFCLLLVCAMRHLTSWQFWLHTCS